MKPIESLTIEQFHVSEDGSQILLDIIPIITQVTPKTIYSILQHPRLPRFHINLKAAEKALAAFSALQVDDNSIASEYQTVVIAEKKDAVLIINIDKDKMRAYAEITNEFGGRKITLADIKSQCDSMSITFGLKPKAMLSLLNKCNQASEGKAFRVLIAEGVKEVNGKNANFKKRIKTEDQRNIQPKLLDNGKVDMYDLGEMFTVIPGTVLMEKIPVTLGRAGKTVTGERIPPAPGKDADFKVGLNVKIDPNNPLQLIATSNGIPLEDGDFIKVDDTLILNNVDVKTGHVNYNGSVVIKGDIKEAMRVDVTGDLTVMGAIENATVNCGGNLIVSKAIIGYQKANHEGLSCKISCKGTLTGTIAQYADLKIGKNLLLSKQLIHCKTSCQGSVKVHDKLYRKGSIVGGTTQANGSITTVTLGVSAGNKTEIDLVGNFKILVNNKEQLIRQLQEIEHLVTNIQQKEAALESLTDKALQEETKKKLFIKKQKIQEANEEVNSKLLEVRSKLTKYLSSTHLTVTKTLFSDAHVLIADKVWKNSQELGPTVLIIEDRKIKLIPHKRAK